MAFAVAGCAHLQTEQLAGNDDFVELTCVKFTVPVKLKANGLGTYRVVGRLCYVGEPEGKALQVLLSGGGYGPVYYDFPYEADTYSYVRAAARAGYATFNLSRIGIGESSRPPGNLVDVNTNAYVVHQVIQALSMKEVTGIEFRSVVTVGHSMGSVMAVAHAVTYPEDIDGLILTGMLHNTNPAYTETVRAGSSLAMFDRQFVGRIWDFTYFTSKSGMREEMFYSSDGVDPKVIAMDEATKETLTLGEIISVAQYDRNETLKINVPVLLVGGDEDFTICGGDFDCSDPSSIINYERQFFSDAAVVETVLLENTGHVINLHRGAPQCYEIMLDWIDRRVEQ
jgi:pimeloyl-ACP methyl ester carboxylesterase